MAFKYTATTLNRIENIFSETEYTIRYEKGSFKAGYCILENKKVVVINKFFSLEAKINCLIEILNAINVDEEKLTEKNRDLFLELKNKITTQN